ncbi:MAG TPA: MBL fold metallo-hydrolase [Stellaceae bacterium]|nr:MBL fold metallo-hydrolase [Stellaceae bacterium]
MARQLDTPAALNFPHAAPPEPGEPVEMAPGIFWLRLRLPYALDHVNVWLLDDGPGWTLIDTGLGDPETQAIWEAGFDRILGGKPITRLIVTHFHPDHIGLAGWITRRFGAPLWMSLSEWLFAQFHATPENAATLDAGRAFYRSTGLDAEAVEQVIGRGHSYMKRTTRLDPTYRRLAAGDEIAIGGRRWRVLTGGGHSIEQVMLYCAADKLFIPADQVIAKISPNVSVWPFEPFANALGLYLTSLRDLRGIVAEDVLVLSSHNLPFYGLHTRIDQLIEHHAMRCGEIAQACADAALSGADLVPVLFRRTLDAHQTGFAIGEVVAHVNYMVETGRLTREADGDGVWRYRTIAGAVEPPL